MCPMREIVILSAVPAELVLLRRSLTEARQANADEHGPSGLGSALWRGQLEGQPVVLAEAGIGKVAMAMVATSVIARVRPAMVVFSGVAGGLDPALEVGDVVIADRLIQHDAGILDDDGLATYQAGHLPFFNPTDQLGYRPDPDLLSAIVQQCASLELEPVAGRRPRIVSGTVLTGDAFVDSAEARRRLHQQFDAAAVEMEGAAMAQVAETLGLPWLVIRALSDLAGSDAPARLAFDRFLEVAARNSAHVLRHVMPRLRDFAGR
jgi:adenosylhomocysteine nucleosidase